MPKKTAKAPVSERALLARLNRKPASSGCALRRCPPNSQWRHDLGRYYEIDRKQNTVTAQHINLKRFARNKGCLRPWEQLQTNNRGAALV